MSLHNKKILFIVRTYCAPDIRVERETAALVRQGCAVETFCLGQDGLPKEQNWAGGKIKRIVTIPEQKGRSTYMKLWSVLAFAVYTLIHGRRFDIVHCNDLDMLPIGVMLKWSTFGRIKVVYDAHEYETEKFHHDGWKKTVAKITERFFIKFADKILTVSDAIANEYKRLYNIEKPAVVLNCPSLKNVIETQILRKNLDIDDRKIIFLYQGGLFPNRGIEMIAEAFVNIQDKNKVIVFMGFGPLEAYIKGFAAQHDNIYFHPSVSTDVLHDFTCSADVGIIFYQNTCLNHYYCSPNKLFEYIMAGLPIIASNLYEMHRILTANENGMVVKGETSKALMAVLESYDADVIKAQRQKSMELRKTYCWETQEKTLLSLYEGITV